MSFVTTVMVGNADKECARLGRAAILCVAGMGACELEGVFAWFMSDTEWWSW